MVRDRHALLVSATRQLDVQDGQVFGSREPGRWRLPTCTAIKPIMPMPVYNPTCNARSCGRSGPSASSRRPSPGTRHCPGGRRRRAGLRQMDVAAAQVDTSGSQGDSKLQLQHSIASTICTKRVQGAGGNPSRRRCSRHSASNALHGRFSPSLPFGSNPPAALTTVGRSTTVSRPDGTTPATVGLAAGGGGRRAGGGGRRTGGGGGTRTVAVVPGTLLGRGCLLRGAGRM